jgi:hypothetical protein
MNPDSRSHMPMRVGFGQGVAKCTRPRCVMDERMAQSEDSGG